MNTDKADDKLRGRVFDGHNDVLTRLLKAGGVSAAEMFLNPTDFHIDKQKALDGNFGGGFFAMWVASPAGGDYQAMMTQAEYDVPLPELVDHNAFIVASSDQLHAQVGQPRTNVGRCRKAKRNKRI